MEMLTAKTRKWYALWTHLFAYTLLVSSGRLPHNPLSHPTQFNQMIPLLATMVNLASNCIKFCWRKLQLTCCLFDPIALNPG